MSVYGEKKNGGRINNDMLQMQKKNTTLVNVDIDKEKLNAEVRLLLETGVWRAVKQESTGRTYYYHTKTKKTCWNLLEEVSKSYQVLPNDNDATDAQAKKVLAQKEARGSNFLKIVENSNDKKTESENNCALVTNAATAAAVLTNVSGNVCGENRENKNNENQSSVLIFGDTETCREPSERLTHETSQLNENGVPFDTFKPVTPRFQRSYEDLEQANRFLTAQLAMLRQECVAMEMALKEANAKLYEKDLALRELQFTIPVANREYSVGETVAVLREQNRELVRQVGELTVVLSRGFNELSHQKVLDVDSKTFKDQMRTVEGGNASQSDQKGSLGPTIDCVLANPIMQKILCYACIRELEELRFSFLSEEEKAVVSMTKNTRLPHTSNCSTYYARHIPVSFYNQGFNRVGYPIESVEEGNNASWCDNNSCNFQQKQQQSPSPQSLSHERQANYRVNAASGTWHSPPPQLDKTYKENLYTNNVAFLHQQRPEKQQQQQQTFFLGEYSRSSTAARYDGGRRDDDKEPFFSELTNGCSTSEIFNVSAAPVLGGFHIRLAH